jgi:transglutaminase-like putative cysteine protease
MLAIYSVPVAVYVDSVPVTPFIIGAAGYLWLLVSDNVDRVRRFGRRFTGDGRDVDAWEPSPLSAAGRRLGFVGVAAAVVLPLLVPSVTGGLLSQLTSSGTGIGNGIGTGKGGGSIDLFAGLSGQLTQSSTVNLLKVTTDENAPFYLRFGVADQLTVKGFSDRTPQGPSLAQGLPDPRTDSGTGGDFTEYHATVQISDELHQALVPVYSDPIKIDDLGDGWSYDPGQQLIYSARSTTKGKKYSFDYVRPTYSPAELKTAEPLAPTDPIQRAYTSTPRDQYVDTKVHQLVAGQKTPYDKVRALYNFFSRDNGFRYTLSTAPANNGSQIASFLQNKTGYCQQYAAALAWMVRDAGIPARVAFGFTRGTAVDSETYQITNRNAHAWAEVYFAGYGWIPFDATPSSGVQGSARSDWAPDTDKVAPTASASSSAVAGGPNPRASTNHRDPTDRAANGENGSSALAGTSGVTSTKGLLIAGAIALLIALLLIPALRRSLLRRHRHAATVGKTVRVGSGPPGDTRDVVVTTESVRARADAHAAWDELIDTMIDYRVPVDPTETPRVTAGRLAKDAYLEQGASSAAVLLGSAEERARYARSPLQGAELTAALRQVRKGVARSATRRARLVATLFPPSVLLRWRLGLTEFSTRSVTLSGRVRDVLVRFSPRRLLPNRSR